MSSPLVSILIPAYNSERTIAETLISALSQTWPAIEIIVVDDGSTDGTLAIASEFEGARVNVVQQPNRGAAAARNRAYGLSRGAYIQWLDADDLLESDKIERQMKVILSDRCPAWLYSSEWASFFNDPATAQFRPSALWHDQTPVDWMVAKLSTKAHMQPATWLVSRELSEAAGPWDESLSADDDGEYFCRVLEAAEYIRFVNEAKVYYRSSGMSLSFIGSSRRKIESQWYATRAHLGTISRMENSPRVDAACVAYLQSKVIDFFPEAPHIITDAQAIAAEFGETLQVPPRLSWKYRWLRVFGWRTAKYASLRAPLLKQALHRSH